MAANLVTSLLLLTVPTGGTPQENLKEMHVRVTVLGFKVEQETWDHNLQVDGKGDEIRVRCDVHVHLACLGEECVCNSYITRVFGDINKYPNRILAGSRSLKGGLKTGDCYPSPNPWVMTGRKAKVGDLPMVVYNDELLTGDKIIVNPVVIEVDGEPSLLTKFSSSVRKLKDSAPEGLIGNLPISATAKIAIVASDGLQDVLGKDGDRPIGCKIEEDGKRCFSPKSITLSPSTARRLANLNSPYGRGVLAIRYEDDASENNHGAYQVFVKIEVNPE